MTSALFDSSMAYEGGRKPPPPQDLKNYWKYEYEINIRCQAQRGDTKSKQVLRIQEPRGDS